MRNGVGSGEASASQASTAPTVPSGTASLNGRGRRPAPETRSTARSFTASKATSTALSSRPSCNSTVGSSMPTIRWAMVTTTSPSVTAKPLPSRTIPRQAGP